jgi:hypothetical protein
MKILERFAIKATSGRFIVLVMVVFACCWVTIANPDRFGLRMFDFAAGLCVGYFGQDRQKQPPPGSG